MWDMMRRNLQRGVLADPDAGTPPPGIVPAVREPAGEVELLGAQLREETQRLFDGALRIAVVPTGSCNACESELETLLGPFHDLERHGLVFVDTPRHADALVVVGPVTRQLEESLHLAEAATPRPRWIVALGDCACDGGFCRDSFAVLGGVPASLEVAVRIPGCPPRPEDILRALLGALGRAHVLARTAPAPAPDAGA